MGGRGRRWASPLRASPSANAARSRRAATLQRLAEVAERRGQQQQATEHLDRVGELFSRCGAKLYLDQAAAEFADPLSGFADLE